MKKLTGLLALLALAACGKLLSSPPPEPPPPPPPAPAAPAPKPPVNPLAEAGLERIEVTVEGPLEDAVQTAVGPELGAPLTQVMARQLIWWINVPGDLRKGDKIEALYQQQPGKEPLLHALRFNSQKMARQYESYLYKADGAQFARFYDAAGQEIEERLRGGPIDEYEQVTSLLRDGRRHKGVDFKAPVGMPVKAPFDVTLTKKNWGWTRNGNCVELHDGRGRRIVFLHLSELPKSLAVGKRFKAGEVVAQSGNTGHSTAPHLHYQLESSGGKLLDPFKEHETFHVQLAPEQMAGFEAARQRYARLFEAATAQPAPAAPAVAAPAVPAAPPPAPPAAPAAPPSAIPSVTGAAVPGAVPPPPAVVPPPPPVAPPRPAIAPETAAAAH